MRLVGTPGTFDDKEEAGVPASGEETETPSPDAEGMPISPDMDEEEGPESVPHPEPSPEVPVPEAESEPEPQHAVDAGESDEAVEVGGAEEPLSAAGLDAEALEAGTAAEASTDAPPQTAVEILDQLLESLESGEFDVLMPFRREARGERPSTGRPPLEEPKDSPASRAPGAAGEDEAAVETVELPLNKAMEGGQEVIEVTSTPKVGPEERVREIRERLAPSPDDSHAEAEEGADGRDTAVQET